MNSNSSKDDATRRKRLRQSNLLESFRLVKKKKNLEIIESDSGENHKTSQGKMSEECVSSSSVTSTAEQNLPSFDEIDIEKDSGVSSGSLNVKVCDGKDSEEHAPSCSRKSNDLSDANQNECDVFEDSIDIFTDTPPEMTEINDENVVEADNTSKGRKEEPKIQDIQINKTPTCSKPLPNLRSTAEHKVLFNCNITPDTPIRPYPVKYKDAWDSTHVRLPCSPSSMYPGIDRETNAEVILPRWELVERSLLNNITNSYELEKAIMQYNFQYAERWKFEDLHSFFVEELEPEESDEFFSNLLPKMVRLALRLPQCCTNPIPLLRKNYNQAISLSQLQIGSLLANAFFCTFPRRNTRSPNSEYATYPTINFNWLFSKCRRQIKNEKFKCLFNYFKRITNEEPTGVLTFERRHTTFTPNWSKSKRPLRKLYVLSEGVIEKEGIGLLQVDFANKNVGGGVLKSGCVQEEIRFLICPELIVSRLFTESLNDNEVLVMTGCEQFNKQTGYADTFKWDGDFRDETEKDSWGRRYTQILAMDATRFNRKDDQYVPKTLLRELNKAFSGFYEPSNQENLTGIATGNWGCGAFKGDPRLKLLIQLLAASESDRDLVYFTFHDLSLKNDADALYEFLLQRNATVSVVFNMLIDYCKYYSLRTGKKERMSLYSFIYEYRYSADSESTDIENDSESPKC